MTRTFDIHDSEHRRTYGKPRARIVMTGIAVMLQVGLCASAAHAQNFGDWSPAVSVDPNRYLVNTAVNDGCPIEAPDGLALYFASNRVVGGTSTGLDIWVAYRANEDAGWAEIERLPDPVNTGANEFCPTPLPGNRLLFVSTRPSDCSGVSTADIYLTRQHPVRGWLDPVPLCGVNSTFEEFSPSFVEADGVTMLYFSSNRAGLHKIYVSIMQEDGTWGTPSPVDELNEEGAIDARPNVRKDGLEIVFDSTRGDPANVNADIFSSTRTSVREPWSPPQRLTIVNSLGSESRPSISRDGTRLYFGSTRANVTGNSGADVFVSTRSGPGNTNGQ
jgi:Tol biopolymer transport system component